MPNLSLPIFGPRQAVQISPPAGEFCPHAVPISGLPAIDLMGLKLHAITQRECVDAVIRELRAGRGGCVITPNLDHLRRCRRDARYACTMRRAELRVADGMPLIWASRIQGTPLPERVAGSDLIFALSEALAQIEELFEKRTALLKGLAKGERS